MGNNTKTHRVSVVIPVKNDRKGIISCLEAIQSQTVKPLEIIVIDSGSTDGTPEAASRFNGVQVIHISPEQFNHGTTRNVGADLATGDYVLFTVQDARAASDKWIEALLDGFTAADVAAVCGHQAVEKRQDTNPVEWYRPANRPAIRTYRYDSAASFSRASAAERRAACGWDNVTAMYRRDILVKIPFRQTVYGEDLLFAIEAYTAGYALAYNPAAVVWHYHFEPSQLTFERSLRTATLRASALGMDSVPPDLLRATTTVLKRLLIERDVSWGDKLFWFFHNLHSIIAVRRACRLSNSARLKGAEELQRLIETLPQRAPQATRVQRA
jgi:rhamnosyltransferase